MGRITIFTIPGCPHSRRAFAALNRENIPYTLICLNTNPEKREDMMALTNKISTPQVFFNTRHVGGADETLAQIEEWRKDTKKYKTPRDHFEGQIAAYPDPQNPRLQVPEHQDTIENAETSNHAVSHNLKQESITLPNGSTVSVSDMIELLKNILPIQSNKSGLLTVERYTFTAKQAIHAIVEHYKLESTEVAISWMQVFLNESILHPVIDNDRFGDTNHLYRLHCHKDPSVLNSYCVWRSKDESMDAVELVMGLKKLMDSIENDILDDRGYYDYTAAKLLPLYPQFEAAVCALQIVDMGKLTEIEKLVFGLNVYNIMIKYAFQKVGAANSDYGRYQFYNNVGFQIGEHFYSFQDWENGILRGNRKAPYATGLQFQKHDPRRQFSVKEVDPRIHFALNCGARSCPPVNLYTVAKIESELSIAAQSFVENEIFLKIDETRNVVQMSQIFQWYLEDFVKKKEELPRHLVKYLHGLKKQAMEKLLYHESKMQVKFLTYDWSLNASDVILFDMKALATHSRRLRHLSVGKEEMSTEVARFKLRAKKSNNSHIDDFSNSSDIQ